MKRLVKSLKHKWLVIIEIVILMSCILVPTILLSPPGKPVIIASLVSFNLNGETKGDIQAQILIENLTTLEFEENKELITLIENDLRTLSHQIQDLERITIYNYSYNPLPGQINLYLENVRFREKKFLREINSAIDSDEEKWWYLDEFIFSPILKEGETKERAYLYSPFEDSDYLSLISYEPPYSISGNISLLRNETVVASLWIPDNGNWTFNDVYYQTLLMEVITFKEKIVGIENISLSILTENETEFNLNHPTLYNLSEPIPSEVAYLFGESWITIDYKKSLTRTEINSVRKVLEKIIISKWYISRCIWASSSHMSTREFIGVVSIMVSIFVGTITAVIMLITIGRKRG